MPQPGKTRMITLCCPCSYFWHKTGRKPRSLVMVVCHSCGCHICRSPALWPQSVVTRHPHIWALPWPGLHHAHPCRAGSHSTWPQGESAVTVSARVLLEGERLPTVERVEQPGTWGAGTAWHRASQRLLPKLGAAPPAPVKAEAHTCPRGRAEGPRSRAPVGAAGWTRRGLAARGQAPPSPCALAPSGTTPGTAHPQPTQQGGAAAGSAP